MKRLFHKALLSSRFWYHYYFWNMILWVLTFPPALILRKESVVYLIFISQMTALTGALGGLATVLAERKADPKMPEIDPEREVDSDPLV